MKGFLIPVVLGAILLLGGCSDRTNPVVDACKNLNLPGCTSSKYHISFSYEINKKIASYLEDQAAVLDVQLAALNSKVSPFAQKSFMVDAINYRDIGSLSYPYAGDGEEKLEGVKVFSSSSALFLPSKAPSSLPKHRIEVRDGTTGASKYQKIREVCERIAIVHCKIAYMGRLDGVWTEKSESQKFISGWIELESVMALPFHLKEVRMAVHSQASEDIYKLVREKKGAISWTEVEAVVVGVIQRLKQSVALSDRKLNISAPLAEQGSSAPSRARTTSSSMSL